MTEHAPMFNGGSPGSPERRHLYGNGGNGSSSPKGTASAFTIVSEGLVRTAQHAAARLEDLWDEIGYETSDKTRELEAIVEVFQEQCNQRVEATAHIKKRFVNQIAELEQKLITICKALGHQADEDLFQRAGNLKERLAFLETALVDYEQRRKVQAERLAVFKAEIDNICAILERPVDGKFQDATGDLTDKRIHEFQQYTELMRAELDKHKKLSIGKIKHCVDLIAELQDIQETSLVRQLNGSLVRRKQFTLSESESADDELGSDWKVYELASEEETADCVSLRASKMMEVLHFQRYLEEEKASRAEQLRDLGSQIAALWTKLEVPEYEREAFRNSVNNFSLTTIRAGEEELARLQQIKRERIGQLVEEVRQEIIALWNDLGYSDIQRMEFRPMTIPAGSCDDADLAQHEEERDNLKNLFEQIKPILKLIQRREVTVNDRYELDALQKDSSRLQMRGARFTEQLAKEEKMTKRIKQLPKWTDELVAKLVQWERENGRSFMYEEKRYLETITEQENKWFEYKEAEKAAKEARRKESRLETQGSFRESPSRSPKSNR